MEQPPEGKLIHFLKELPDKYLLILVLLIMLGVAMRFGAIEPREIWLLVRDITIAIISIAGYKRITQAADPSNNPTPTQINAEVVNTPEINNDSMNDAVINVTGTEDKKE